MACNALGSILNKFCDSCSCSFGTLFNCSKNQVLVVNPSSDDTARKVVEATLQQQQLSEAVRVFRRDSSSLQTRSVSKQKAEKMGDDATRMAVVLTRARQESSFRSNRHISEAEGVERERYVERSENTSLDGRFEKRAQKPHVSPHEVKRMQKRALQVKKFGSAAVFLWQLCREHQEEIGEGFDFLSESGILSKEQERIMRGLTSEGILEAALNEGSFGTVATQAQEIFLSAAEGFPEPWIKQLEEKSWLPTVEEESSLENAQEPENYSNELQNFLRKIKNWDQSGAFLEDLEAFEFAKLRCQYFCFVLEIFSPSKKNIESLRSRHFEKIQSSFRGISSYDGTICYLFICLNKTLTPTKLKELGLRDETIKRFRKTNQQNPAWLTEIRKAETLKDLQPQELYLLYRIAKKCPIENREAWQKRYFIQDWVKPPELQDPPKKENASLRDSSFEEASFSRRSRGFSTPTFPLHHRIQSIMGSMRTSDPGKSRSVLPGVPE